MVKERVGATYVHDCGNIFQARTPDVTRCPRCTLTVKKGTLFRVTKKEARALWLDQKGRYEAAVAARKKSKVSA